MKKVFCIILSAIIMTAVLLSGCGSGGSKETFSKATAGETAAATVTETESVTESATQEYTAVQLASKRMDEIKEIMGGDYQTERAQLCNAFSSEPINYIHNYDVLPGFAFTGDGSNEYYNIAIINGGKLNNKISSDMTYSQIADIIGDMDGMMIGQGYNLAATATVDGYTVTFCFMLNDYLSDKIVGGKITSDEMRAGDPEIQSIGLLRESSNAEDAPEEADDAQDSVKTINVGDEITLSGVLSSQAYAVNAANGGTVSILNLDQPLKCYLNDGMNYDGSEEYSIDSVQVNLDNSEQYFGQSLTVSGTVVLAHTAHHLRDIVLVDPVIQQ